MKHKNIIIINNPLVKHYLTIIRDKKTTYHDFRDGVDKLSLILAYELSRELTTGGKNIQTPLAKFKGAEIKEEIVLVPVLRAGLGLLSGFLELFPKAKVGHIGVFRNEDTLEPVRYFFKCPPVNPQKRRIVFILDPMLATGGSLVHSIKELHKQGMKKIVVASLVSALEGLNKVMNRFKNVKIYTCAVDSRLNNKGFIVPGLGDAGDRMFGT
ncbi:MAG TPA: uracil phosphoribosyltransferase [Ignavibacteria bacterium]